MMLLLKAKWIKKVDTVPPFFTLLSLGPTKLIAGISGVRDVSPKNNLELQLPVQTSTLVRLRNVAICVNGL